MCKKNFSQITVTIVKLPVTWQEAMDEYLFIKLLISSDEDQADKGHSELKTNYRAIKNFFSQ